MSFSSLEELDGGSASVYSRHFCVFAVDLFPFAKRMVYGFLSCNKKDLPLTASLPREERESPGPRQMCPDHHKSSSSEQSCLIFSFPSSVLDHKKMVVHSPRPSLVCPLSATFPVARSLVRSRPQGRKGKEERKYTTHIYDNMGGKQGNKRDSVILVGGRGFHFSVDLHKRENKRQLLKVGKCTVAI